MINATDVLNNAGLEPTPLEALEPTKVDVSESGQIILTHLQGYPVSLDELLVMINMAAAEVTCALVELELAGFVEQGPLGYIRTS